MDVAARFLQERLSIPQLAHLLGRRPSTVRRLLVEAGLQSDCTAYLGHSKEQLTTVLATRHRRGESITSLVRTTGISRRQIRTILQSAAPADSDPPSDQMTRADRAQIVKLYQQGASIRGLAQSLNRSYRAVRAVLVDAAIPLRRRGNPSWREDHGAVGNRLD